MFEPKFATKILQRKLDHEFADEIISRGHKYFLQQAVMSVQVNGDFISAKVIGSEIYKVVLDCSNSIDLNYISASCTCPYYNDGSFCKHLWAFILEIDRQGISSQMRFQKDIYLSRAKEIRPADFSDNQSIRDVTPLQSQILQPISSDLKLSNWRSIFNLKNHAKKNSFNHPQNQLIFIVIEPDQYSEDTVQLKFFVSDKKPDGSCTPPRPLSLPQNGQIKTGDPKLDAAILSATAFAVNDYRDTYRQLNYFSNSSVRSLKINSLKILMHSLLETNKVFLSKEDFLIETNNQIPSHLISAYFNSLNLIIEENATGYLITGKMLDSEKQTENNINAESDHLIPLKNLNLFIEPNLFQAANKLGFIDLAENEKNWFSELVQHDIHVPFDDTEAFLETILNQDLNFKMPASLDWPHENIIPTPKLHLTVEKSRLDYQDDQNKLNRYAVDLKFQYGIRLISLVSLEKYLVASEDKKIYLRNTTEEHKIFQTLPIQLLSNSKSAENLPLIHFKNIFEFVTISLSLGIETIVENKKIETAKDFNISVSSDVDWFDVHGEADFNGRWVRFPTILEAISKGENFIPLPDGSLGFINDQMVKRLQKFTQFADPNSDDLRFSKAQGLILNSILEGEDNVKTDAVFKRLKDKIKNFSGIEACKPPEGFKGKLRKYQQEGLGWLKFLESYELGGILADDMGLGKTIQCLAFLESRRAKLKRGHKTSLLLAPKTLLPNWKNETHKFTPQLKVHIHAGLGRELSKDFLNQQDLVVVTYQTMLRDFDFLKDITWSCIILDEAQAIKNSEALVAKAVKQLSGKFKLAMTGTPIENSIQDLFSISDFVNPGFLNGKKRSAHLKLDESLKETLSKAFKPVLLRRTKEQVLKDLPDKVEQIISVELESKQLKAYNELKRFYQSQLISEIKERGINRSQIKILAALTRLRQAALHPALIDPSHAKTKSAKFEAVFEMLDEIISENHRVLIFSQFTSLLALLKKELDVRKIEYCYLDGQSNKREHIVNNFKKNQQPVFLMSLKAGGVGLNLVEADYVFLLDPWWNPAVEAQAIDRVHRIGQKRAVNAYRFIAKNTVEEKIIELQQTKKNISAEMFGEKASMIRNLTAMDIENIFS